MTPFGVFGGDTLGDTFGRIGLPYRALLRPVIQPELRAAGCLTLQCEGSLPVGITFEVSPADAGFAGGCSFAGFTSTGRMVRGRFRIRTERRDSHFCDR